MAERIVLGERLDSAAARTLLSALQERQGGDIELDGGGVRAIGGLAAQILLAASRACKSEGIALRILASEPMRKDLERLGLEEELLAQEGQS